MAYPLQWFIPQGVQWKTVVVQYPRTTTLKRLDNVLLRGEVVIDTDMNKLFYGDGTTAGGVCIVGQTPDAVATQSSDGLMSSSDKRKLDKVFERASQNNAPPTLPLKDALATPSGRALTEAAQTRQTRALPTPAENSVYIERPERKPDSDFKDCIPVFDGSDGRKLKSSGKTIAAFASAIKQVRIADFELTAESPSEAVLTTHTPPRKCLMFASIICPDYSSSTDVVFVLRANGDVLAQNRIYVDEKDTAMMIPIIVRYKPPEGLASATFSVKLSSSSAPSAPGKGALIIMEF